MYYTRSLPLLPRSQPLLGKRPISLVRPGSCPWQMPCGDALKVCSVDLRGFQGSMDMSALPACLPCFCGDFWVTAQAALFVGALPVILPRCADADISDSVRADIAVS